MSATAFTWPRNILRAEPSVTRQKRTVASLDAEASICPSAEAHGVDGSGVPCERLDQRSVGDAPDSS